MFIAHGEKLRKYAPWIMAGVLLLLIPSFVFLFSDPGGVGKKGDSAPMIGGKPVKQTELVPSLNAVRLQYLWGNQRDLPRGVNAQEQMMEEALQRIVLVRKAKELGVVIRDEDVVKTVRSLPFFLDANRQFNAEQFRRMLIQLNNYGISEAAFEDIVRQDLAIGRLQQMVAAGAKVTPLELEMNYAPLNEELSIEYVEISAEERKSAISVTDDEARAQFEQNKEMYRTEPKVKVRYVLFSIENEKRTVVLPDSELQEYYQRNLAKYAEPGKEPKPFNDAKEEVRAELLGIRALRQADNRATEMTVKLVFEEKGPRPDFAKVAAEFGLTPVETDFFDSEEKLPGVKAGSQFNDEAFTLSADVKPFSDRVPGEDGYYVMEFVARKPSEIPPFEQVKDRVVDQLKSRRAMEEALKEGRDIAAKIKESLAQGKSFREACAPFKLEAKAPEPFRLADSPADLPLPPNITQAALGMKDGTVSQFVPTFTGGVIFYLKGRTPPDEKKFAEDKERFSRLLLERNQQFLWQSWVSGVIRDAQISMVRTRRPPQPVAPAGAAGS